MKTIMDGEERRREILLTARALFIQKGYDQTSINDILKIVDIAKGTFYYYFSSKEEVLHDIIMDIVEEGAARAESILQDTSIPLIKRIVMAIMAQAPEFEGALRLADEMHKVDNSRLEQLYRRTMLKKMTLVLDGAIKQAQEQGIIHTDYPRECIESILLMGHMMFDCETFEWAAEEYPIKIQAFLRNIERMLGTKEGEFSGFIEMFHNTIKDATVSFEK